MAAAHDDTAAVALTMQQDQGSFGVLFDRHSAAVFGLCVNRLSDRQAAEDALFVTFLEAWRRRRQMRVVGGSLRPWILAVALDVACDRRGVMRRHRVALARYATSSWT